VGESHLRHGLNGYAPLTVADVVPRGPAQQAGLRRGSAVLTINGQPVAHLRRLQAAARLDWAPLAVNRLSVRTPGRDSVDLELRSELVPMPFAALFPSGVGLLRLDGFAASEMETGGFARRSWA
jgi:C-terminal processing protease CtpA/Prc